MKLSQIKNVLGSLETIEFQLPDGTFVPEHFHVTEVGLITKHFIDCGGTVRNETHVNFQLWDANDYEHRLKPKKLLNIIQLSEKALGIGDFEIEVEYQNTTIGKYNLDFNGEFFELSNKQTACLAKDQCCDSTEKQKKRLQNITKHKEPCCTPEGNCCK